MNTSSKVAPAGPITRSARARASTASTSVQGTVGRAQTTGRASVASGPVAVRAGCRPAMRQTRAKSQPSAPTQTRAPSCGPPVASPPPLAAVAPAAPATLFYGFSEVAEPFIPTEVPEVVEPEPFLPMEVPEAVEPEPFIPMEVPEVVEPEPFIPTEPVPPPPPPPHTDDVLAPPAMPPPPPRSAKKSSSKKLPPPRISEVPPMDVPPMLDMTDTGFRSVPFTGQLVRLASPARASGSSSRPMLSATSPPVVPPSSGAQRVWCILSAVRIRLLTSSCVRQRAAPDGDALQSLATGSRSFTSHSILSYAVCCALTNGVTGVLGS